MDEVTLAVQHDVAIVSVFDLQQKEQKAVGSHAADEVISSLQIGHSFINIFTGLGSASDSHTDSVVTIAGKLHQKSLNEIIIVLNVLCCAQKDELNYKNTVIETINIQ